MSSLVKTLVILVGAFQVGSSFGCGVKGHHSAKVSTPQSTSTAESTASESQVKTAQAKADEAKETHQATNENEPETRQN